MAPTADVIAEASWTKMALCAAHPGQGWWFPEDYDDKDASKAIAICRACPVQDECLSYAIATGQSEGIWGSTTPSQRRVIAREVHRAK